MIRWLKIARAEFLRDFTTSIRYPLELLTGVFVLYVLFMGLFMGAKLLAGRQALSGNLDGVVIGYTMWFFALMAINTMSIDIESEARQGTLEQVYLHAPNYLGLLWVRAVVHLAMGAGAGGRAGGGDPGRRPAPGSTVTWQAVPAVLVSIVLTIGGLCGFGLILGGLSLVFKRIGQLERAGAVQPVLPGLHRPRQHRPALAGIVAHLPLARGVDMLKVLFGDGLGAAGQSGQLGWLAVDTLLYALIGSLVFYAMERVARKGGIAGEIIKEGKREKGRGKRRAV